MTSSRRNFLEVGASLVGFAGLSSLGLSPRLIEPARAPMKILILGGTGFIGPHQVAYAKERGHQLTLFNRGRSNLFPGIETLLGDRDGKLDALKGRKWDAVIDNSGFFPRHARDSAELLKNAADRYLFVSSISAYDTATLKGGQDEYEAPIAKMANPADETEQPYGPSYGARKALCEQEVIKAFGKDRAIIVRPGLISGPGDPTERVRHWIRRADKGGEVLVPGTRDRPMQLIDGRDMSNWIVRLVEDRRAGLFNAVGLASYLSSAEFMGAARAVSSSNVTFTFVDDAFLTEKGVRGWSWPVGLQGLPFMQITNKRAIESGLTFRPLTATLTDMLTEMKAADPSGTSTAKAGPGPEKEAEVLAAWKAREIR